MGRSTLRQKIQSSTKKIVLNEDIPQTMGFSPQPLPTRGIERDLTKSFTPEKKTSEAAGGDFLKLAKDIEAKFGDVFSEDLKAIYDGLKNVWSHIRPPEGKPAYSLGHPSQEKANEVLFTIGKEINEEMSHLKAFLASPGFDKTSNAIDIVSSYLGKLKNKVEEFENILTSGFEEPPRIGFKLENIIKDLKFRKIIKEDINKTYSSGIGERILERIFKRISEFEVNESIDSISLKDSLKLEFRHLNEEEIIEVLDGFLDKSDPPLQFLPEEWEIGKFRELNEFLKNPTEESDNPTNIWDKW